LESIAPDRSGGISLFAGTTIMKKAKLPQVDEPVGIVISRGSEPEKAPRFSAYEWSPGPDDELEPELQPA